MKKAELLLVCGILLAFHAAAGYAADGKNTGLPVVNAADYGAVPDDGKDDTPAVTAAITACCSGAAKTLSFPAGTLQVGTVTIPDTVSTVVFKGTLLAVAPRTTVTIAGPFTAGPYQVFSGEGRVEFVACHDILVDWFGARNDGSADATAAINKAMDALPKFANLVFGGGEYLVVAGNLAPIQTTRVVQINGQGMDTTRITFNPAAESILFTFKPTDVPGALVWRCGIRNMSIYGVGAAKKTAIRVVEGRDMTIENIVINYVGATDTESIGLLLQNRDESTVRNMLIYAPRPILVANNPYPNQQTGLDHWCFTDMGLYGTKPKYPLIEVEDGCNLSNVVFDGRQVWVGGNGGFYWDSTTKSTGNGINISFSNIRWESAGMKQTNPTFYLKPYSQAGPVYFNNIFCGTNTTGFYLRNIKQATFTAINVGGLVPGCHCYDIDSSCDRILFNNFGADQNAGTPVVTGLTKLFSAGFSDYYPPETENIKYYVNDSIKSESSKYVSLMDHRVWTKVIVLDGKAGDGYGYILPGHPSSLSQMQISITYDEGKGSAGGGHFLVTGKTPDATSVKISGTPDIVSGINQPGKVCVYKNTGSDAIRIQNNLGEARTFSIIVYYNSPSFPK